jgi:outer membrane protein assembly factor BamB
MLKVKSLHIVCFGLFALVGTGSRVVRGDDWPQWLGPQRDGVWRETGIIDQFSAVGLKVRWRAPVGMGYTGPAVANGKVYVMDRFLQPGKKNPANPFARGSVPGNERVLCLDESDGKVLWKHEYDCPYTVSYPYGPRTTPTVHQGKVYTLGAEGHLYCFEADTGKIVWSRALKDDYKVPAPLWGFAAHPLVDGQKLICVVGGEGSTAVAFDKDTGQELWRALSAQEPGYCPPMIFEAGGKRQLIVWHPEAVNSLDPETGKLYWSQPFDVRSGLTIPTPRKTGDLLLVSSFYNGSMMLRLDAERPAAKLLWRGKSNSERNTDGLHAIMCTPFVEDGYIYGACSYGQFRCLKAGTGERVWETYEPTGGENERWANAFVVKNGDRFFISNEEGDLIIAQLSPAGYRETSRTHLQDPTNPAPGRDVVWSHPAYANRSIYARNDKELICVSLSK